MSKLDHINIHYYSEWRQKLLKDFQATYSTYLNEVPLRSAVPPTPPDTSVQAYAEYLLEQSPERGSH